MSAFPSNPIDGQIYQLGPRSWYWSDSAQGWLLNYQGPTGVTGPTGPQGTPGVLLTALTVDTFTGDGNTVTFTLSVTPQSILNTLVNVDGLVQTPNINYTLAGNQITFVESPVPSATIDVITFLTGQPVTGPAGTNGSNGTTGPTGPRGGPTGPLGPTGPYGGPTGPTGDQGPIGPQGNTGPVGYTGPQGQSGNSGSNGSTGPTGYTGSMGFTGATGPTGYVGVDGATGPTGPAGNDSTVTGPTGSVGPTGPAGSYNQSLNTFDTVTFQSLTVSGNAFVLDNLQVNGNINISSGNITSVSGNSASFFGDVNGIGALYAGLQFGAAIVANPVIQTAAHINDYAQNNFQNLSSGNIASTDWVATADNGSDTVNYIDMGIAGSGWDGTQGNSLGTALYADDGYLYVQGGTGGGNLVVGTSVSGTVLKIVSGGIGSGAVVAVFNPPGTTSQDINTGALVLNGGLGVSGNLNVGGTISINGQPFIGSTGPTGAIGATGAASAVTGPTGAASTVTGPTGMAGSNGATGPTGAAGAAGSNGATGPTGAASTVTGPTGSAGSQGATGPAGSGATGPTGPTPNSPPVTGSAYQTSSAISVPSSTPVTVVSFTLPSAGTWDVVYTMRAQSGTAFAGEFGVYDPTGTIVPNSEILSIYMPSTTGAGTGTGRTFITTTGSATYTLRAWASTGSFSSFSDINGRTGVTWTQLTGGYVGATGPTGIGSAGATGPTGAGATGPTGAASTVTGPTGSIAGLAVYSRARRQANQSVAVNNKVIWDNIDITDSRVAYDLTTGNITLTGGYTYSIMASIPSMTVGGRPSFVLYNVTNAATIGSSQTIYSPTDAAINANGGGPAQAAIYAGTNINVAFIANQMSGSGTIGAAANGDFPATAAPWIQIQSQNTAGATGATGPSGGPTGPTGASPNTVPVYGSNTAPVTGSFSTTTSATATTIMTVPIPSAGTWQITAVVNAGLQNGNECTFALFDGSGSLVAGTENKAGYVGGGATYQGQGTSVWVVTTVAAVNYTVRAWSPGAVAGFTINNGGDGRTYTQWIQLTGGYIGATGPTGSGGGSNYGNSNVASFLANFGSNTITTTGNITAANFSGNISITGNIQGTSSNVQLVSGGYTATFDNTGMLTVPGTVGSTNYLVVNSANGQPEGGQVVLAWKGITGLTSQGNSTWNMDVDGSNQYRVFYQNAVGAAAVVMSANVTTNDVTFASNVIVGGGQLNKVTTALNTVTATTTNPTKASSVTSDWITIVDEGNGWAVCSFSLSWSSSTGAANGSGSYLWLLPGGYQFNSTYHPFSTASAMPTSGADVRCILPGSAGHVSGTGFTGQLVVSAYDATHFRLVNFGLQMTQNTYNYGTAFNGTYVDNGDWSFVNSNACWSGSFRFKKA